MLMGREVKVDRRRRTARGIWKGSRSRGEVEDKDEDKGPTTKLTVRTYNQTSSAMRRMRSWGGKYRRQKGLGMRN